MSAPCRFTFADLTDKSTDLRKASAAAIGNIRDQAAAVLDQLAARRELPPEAIPELRSIYTGLVPVTKWHVLGPFAFDQPPGFAGGETNRPQGELEWFREQTRELACCGGRRFPRSDRSGTHLFNRRRSRGLRSAVFDSPIERKARW